MKMARINLTPKLNLWFLKNLERHLKITLNKALTRISLLCQSINKSFLLGFLGLNWALKGQMSKKLLNLETISFRFQNVSPKELECLS